MKNKEEVIREAWGFNYAHDIDEDGYRTYSEFDSYLLNQWSIDHFDTGFNEVLKYYWVRPKSLSGIENNNGWIKIESESDLPEHGYYEVIKRNSGYASRATLDNEFGAKSQFKNYSHYQKIVSLPLPIY